MTVIYKIHLVPAGSCEFREVSPPFIPNEKDYISFRGGVFRVFKKIYNPKKKEVILFCH